MNKLRLGSLLASSLLVLSMVGFQACNSSEKSRTEQAIEETGDAVEADTKDAVNEASTTFQTERDKAVANLEEQRDKLDQKIDELQQKLDRSSDKTKKTMNRQADKLKSERRDLDRDIDKAKNATEDAWQDIKSGFKKAGRTIGDSFEEAGDRLDSDKNE